MAIKNHQDVNDLLNIMLNNLVEDPLCGSYIRSLFQCCSMSIKLCPVCSNIQLEKTFEFSLTSPVLHSVSRKRNVSLSNLIYSHHFLNENGDNILCKKCNNRVKFSIAKLLSTFPEVLILTLDRCSFDKDKLENVIDDSPIQISKTLNLNFNSLREINGSPVVYKPVAAVGRIGSESAQYGHFISYIIEPGVVTKIDDTKIKKVPTSILNTDNFQRQLFIAVYQKQKLPFPNGEKENLWSVSDEVLAKTDAIFQVEQDKDLGKLYLSSFKSLQNNE